MYEYLLRVKEEEENEIQEQTPNEVKTEVKNEMKKELKEEEVEKPKKKRKEKNVLTLQQRIQVITEYPACPSARLLSEKYGCGKTQILNIMRNKHVYLELWANSNSAVSKPIARPNALLYLSLELTLNEWIVRAKAYSSMIPVQSIRRKAKEISKVLGISSFYPSTRWLQRFRKKYTITDEFLITNPNDFMTRVPKSLKIEDIINELKSSMLPHLLVPASSSESKDRRKNISIDGPMRASNMELSDRSDDNSMSESRYPIVRSVTSVNRTFRRKFETATHTKNIENFTDDDDDKRSVQYTKIEDDEDVELVEILPDTAYHSSDDYDNNSFHGNVYNENINDDNSRSAMNHISKEITTYTEAIEHLKLLEYFAFSKHDLRAIGLINQLENYLKERAFESN